MKVILNKEIVENDQNDILMNRNPTFTPIKKIDFNETSPENFSKDIHLYIAPILIGRSIFGFNKNYDLTFDF